MLLNSTGNEPATKSIFFPDPGKPPAIGMAFDFGIFFDFFFFPFSLAVILPFLSLHRESSSRFSASSCLRPFDAIPLLPPSNTSSSSPSFSLSSSLSLRPSGTPLAKGFEFSLCIPVSIRCNVKWSWSSPYQYCLQSGLKRAENSSTRLLSDGITLRSEFNKLDSDGICMQKAYHIGKNPEPTLWNFPETECLSLTTIKLIDVGSTFFTWSVSTQ